MYPQLSADLSVINWIIPRQEQEFHDYLTALVTAGIGDSLIFGSDQMVWPESRSRRGRGQRRIHDLGAERAIFHDNAARLLRLDTAEGR